MKMRINGKAWLVLAVLILAVSAQAKQPRIIEGSWIVELESPPTVEFRGGQASALMGAGGPAAKPLQATAPAVTGASGLDVESPAVRAYAAHLDAERGAVLNEAAFRLGRGITPRHVFRHLLNGFSVELSEAEARILAGLPGVRSVTPDFLHELHTDASAEWIGANLYWSGTGGIPNPNRGEGMVLGLIDTGINWEHDYFKATSPTDGFTIVNPRDRFFGLCNDAEVECNGKLIGVYDFTDEGTKGRDVNGHGSHVASIAVGNRFDFSLEFAPGLPSINFSTSGIAPRASLISYKVCEDGDPDDDDDDGGCPNSALLAALEQAATDQVDAINYSIGTTGVTPSPWVGFNTSQKTVPRVFLNLRDAGIVPVTSAGNSGPNPSTVSSPANAPWTVAVGNATHDRRLVNRLINVTGGPFVLGNLNGEGLTDGLSARPIVHAGDFGNALCGTGTPELRPTCDQLTGSSNPFEPGTFNGEIVVCDRGVYGRVEKGFNVREAGAGGMILANDSEFGESINADLHCLPATHVGEADGDRLREWLASGNNHAGGLSGLQRVTSSDFGGLLATSSASGPPTGAPDVMKPNLVAPGISILGASEEPGQIAFQGGTSMSSPQVAGAALLLRNSHPAWPVSAIISALETTARPDAVLEGDGRPAAAIRRGAGGVRVNNAARIGLYLPVSRQQFIDANPQNGGVPGDLNLPGIVSENCVGSCTFTRRVQALLSGTWTVGIAGDLDIQVEPSVFSLFAGGQQELTITIRPGTVQVGQWGRGSVILTGPSGTVQQSLPVGARISAGTLPEERSISASRNRGQSVLNIDELERLPEAVFRTSPLVKPDRTVRDLRQDPTPGDPYSGGEGTAFVLVDVPAGTLMLYAETVFSDARDIDLFVGRDDNGNGQPDLTEERCRSITPDELELCVIERPEPGTWWVLIQNWDASSPTAQDRVDLDVAVLTASADPSFFAAGPGDHPGGPLTVPLYWDQPAMKFGERWIGALGVSTNPDALANVGVVPVKITRNQQSLPEDTAMFPGQTRAVVVPSAVEHNRLFLDVPSGRSRLEFEVKAPSGVSATLAHRPFSDLIGVEPGSPSAPAANVSGVQTINTADGFRLVFDPASTVAAGRWYLKLNNASGSEVATEVHASFAPVGNASDLLRRGLWDSRNRENTFSGIQWQRVADLGFVVWYTYNEDGTPAFYISDAASVEEGGSSWKAPLFRVTSNGVRQNLNVVGEVGLTALAENEMIFSWRINGSHGSELFAPVHGSECTELDGQMVDLLGHWFPPNVFEGGATALFVGEIEAWIRYYFDQFGNPRWVQFADLGNPIEPQVLTSGRALEVLDFRGACPYCEPLGAGLDDVAEVVGVFERELFSVTSGREVLEFVAGPPLNTDYSTDRQLGRLSEVRACP